MGISNLRIGQEIDAKGFFTQARYMRGVSLGDMERRVGYREGRLAEGAALLFLTRMPRADEFQFRGYTHMSNGVPLGHRPDAGTRLNAEQSLVADGVDVAALKAKIISGTFMVEGWTRLSKVLPARDAFGSNDFPPGPGIPQWEAMKPLPWRVAAILKPGETYRGDYT